MTTQIIGKTAGSLISQGYVGFPLAWFYGEKGYSGHPDSVLLNGNRAKIDAGEVCRQIPDISDIPVLIVTVDGEKSDQLKIVACGSDDNFTKSVDFQELLTRVQAVMRRNIYTTQDNAPGNFDDGELEVEWRSHQVWVRGQRVKLTPTEFKILAFLIENRGWIVTHEQLLKKVWGPKHIGDKSFIKLYIRYLRQKIERTPSNPQLILTERGVGYRFSVQSKESFGEGIDQMTGNGFPTNHDEPDKPRDLAKSGAVK